MLQVGTHDSLATRKLIKQWYLKPFHFLFCTQELTLEEQIQAGVIYFDFRFVKEKTKKGYVWRAAHGMGQFKITLDEAIAILDKYYYLCQKPTVYCRFVVESVKNPDDFLLFNEDIHKIWRPRPYLKVVAIATKNEWGNGWNNFEVEFLEWNVLGANDRETLCKKVEWLFTTQTFSDKINVIAAYHSGGIPIKILGWQPKIKFNGIWSTIQIPIPKLAATALTKIVLRGKWFLKLKNNNTIVLVDFLPKNYKEL